MKILEFVHKNLVKPTGGPNGYVYNLTSLKSENIDFCYLDDFNESIGKKYKKYFPSFIVEVVKGIRENNKIKKIMRGCEILENINQYDIIHFHTTNDLHLYRKQLENYKGKIVLTCHTPIPPFMELYNDYYSKIMRIICGKKSVKKYKKICEDAFAIANNIVFPCVEAEEAYYELWDGYSAMHDSFADKISYIPTGCIEKKTDSKKSILGDKYNKKFVICYAGRHNKSKGYDILVDIAKTLAKDDSLKFIICGNQGPLYDPKISNWHEIGWTTKVDSYIKSSDIFILPNRWTYFDLIFLEVLSMGQIIVASKTGGNKYFSKYPNCGIFLYEDVDDAIKYINMIRKMPAEQAALLRKNNRELYLKEFSNFVFSKRYCSYYSDIINNCVKKEY